MDDDLWLQTCQARETRALWVAEHIIPYEADMRRWLNRWHVSQDMKNELLQDAYCQIAALETVDHIDRPIAYFYSIVRNRLARQMRRRQVVPFDLIAEVEAFRDHHPLSVEDNASDRLAYEKILAIIEHLPNRCREIIQLRQIEGWSHKEIARHLGISEKTVENQVTIGLKAIRVMWDRKSRSSATILSRHRIGG